MKWEREKRRKEGRERERKERERRRGREEREGERRKKGETTIHWFENVPWVSFCGGKARLLLLCDLLNSHCLEENDHFCARMWFYVVCFVGWFALFVDLLINEGLLRRSRFSQVACIKVCVRVSDICRWVVCAVCMKAFPFVSLSKQSPAPYSLSRLLGLVRISLANLQVCLAALSRAEWGLPWKRSRLGRK